jgi:hypothetical protein
MKEKQISQLFTFNQSAHTLLLHTILHLGGKEINHTYLLLLCMTTKQKCPAKEGINQSITAKP